MNYDEVMDKRKRKKEMAKKMVTIKCEKCGGEHETFMHFAYAGNNKKNE